MGGGKTPVRHRRVWHPRGLRDLPAAFPPGFSARKKRALRFPDGKALSGGCEAGAGLPEPGGCAGESPSRTGTGRLAGGRVHPSRVAAAGTWQEEPSPAASRVFVFTYSRTYRCVQIMSLALSCRLATGKEGVMGRERCTSEPDSSPNFGFAGRTEKAGRAPGHGAGVPRTPYLQHGQQKGRVPTTHACQSWRVPVPGYGGEGWRATALPRTASGCFLREGKEINHQRDFIVIIIIIIIAIIVSLHINK